MVNVLFVCLGNICRSPSAEAVFRALVEEQELSSKIHTDSAGTGAWHMGNPPDARAQQIGKTRGVFMSDLKARQVTPQDFEKFDYILAMDNSNFANLEQMKPSNYKGQLKMMLDYSDENTGEVPDPYYGDLSDYEHVFDLLGPAAAGLLADILTQNDVK
ncbi:MAG: low molecular weight phosphotyrosine protein phosphatase [Sneathiella sp.]|nr:low molecular weight phosphotyrosine protein phosphatase [Sneathiella sp.]